MNNHIRKLDTKIRNKEAELNEIYIRIQKLEEEIATLHDRKLVVKKTGNSRGVINRRPKIDL